MGIKILANLHIFVIMKWQQIGNRKSVSQNNICNRNKITAKKIQNLNKYI
jgi:hypothetical protein